ncbi:hypothetical protein OG389_01005 [Streptomyces sp. NBC_00435]|uniref:hypothetical protein n=1 Tax=Streptomyces sp. NBC_00435 TaxID=2903649 RepID=UPI002E21FAB3
MDRSHQHANDADATAADDRSTRTSRGVWVIITALVSLLVGLAAGIIYGATGDASFVAATGFAAGAFVTSMTLGMLVLAFMLHSD